MDLIFCYELLIVWDLRSLQHLLSPSFGNQELSFWGFIRGGRPTIIGQVPDRYDTFIAALLHGGEDRGLRKSSSAISGRLAGFGTSGRFVECGVVT
jgi:hypothetical protein